MFLTILAALPFSLLLYPQLALASASYSTKSTINRVVVVGGTHGNEYTGVWCIKAIKKHLQQNDKESLFQTKYPSLDISTLLANPQAHLENKRFVDSDLNREFPLKKLFHDNTDDEDMSVEEQLAQEINSLLGPKLEDTGSEQTDVVVDLHTTTANMGITVIVPEGDSLMAQAAAYVIAKCQEEKEQIKNVMNGQNGNDSQSVVSCRCLMHSIPDKNLRPNLSSTGKHGFTIEVGPVPQGVLRHDAVENTQRALHYLLEFLHKRNENEGQVSQELKTLYPEGKVPCFLSAPAKRSGEISGKITWPCDDENPNFPTLIIHKNIQDKDFQIIRKGDPLFVRWDGSTINYNGSHGDEVYLMFVNEGGYYYKSSGTGIGVAVASQFSLRDGMIHRGDVATSVEMSTKVCDK